MQRDPGNACIDRPRVGRPASSGFRQETYLFHKYTPWGCISAPPRVVLRFNLQQIRLPHPSYISVPRNVWYEKVECNKYMSRAGFVANLFLHSTTKNRKLQAKLSTGAVKNSPAWRRPATPPPPGLSPPPPHAAARAAAPAAWSKYYGLCYVRLQPLLRTVAAPVTCGDMRCPPCRRGPRVTCGYSPCYVR